ncbi:MAG: twin-arginine translocase TatA/TatE family subunit [bacterium]
MFGIGTPELLLILVVALIFLGPRRLPEVGKALGKALGELRRASNDLRDSIELETRRSEQAERANAARAAMREAPVDPARAAAAPGPVVSDPAPPIQTITPQESRPRGEPDREAPGDPNAAGS